MLERNSISLNIQFVDARIICVFLEVLKRLMIPASGGSRDSDDPALFDSPLILLRTILTLLTQHHLVPIFLMLDCFQLLHEFALQGGPDLGNRRLRYIFHFNLFFVLVK